MLEIAERHTQDRRTFDEYLRRKQAHEDLVPIDSDEEIASDELPQQQEATAAVSEPAPEPLLQDPDERLHRMYDSVRHLSRGPVLAEPRKAPRTRGPRLPDTLTAQIGANELYIDPHTGLVEPLSPPPAADD